MRGFRCHYYIQPLDNYQYELVKVSNSACWADIRNIIRYNHSYIYIEDYDYPTTRPILKTIVGLVNNVTDCTIGKKRYSIEMKDSAKYKDRKFIVYKLLGDYGKDLILLNFIRLLWNKNANRFNIVKFVELLKGMNLTDKDIQEVDSIPFLIGLYADCMTVNGTTTNHDNGIKELYPSMSTEEFLKLEKGLYQDQILRKMHK